MIQLVKWTNRNNFLFNLLLLYSILQIRDEATKAGVAPSREALWQYFVNKSANNLHIVLAMSPVGDTLKNRCRNFPGLVNNTSIDWFMPWPRQALFAVASRFLEEVLICLKFFGLSHEFNFESKSWKRFRFG